MHGAVRSGSIWSNYPNQLFPPVMANKIDTDGNNDWPHTEQHGYSYIRCAAAGELGSGFCIDSE